MRSTERNGNTKGPGALESWHSECQNNSVVEHVPYNYHGSHSYSVDILKLRTNSQDAGTTNHWHSNDIYRSYQLEYLRAPLFGSVTLPSPE